LNLIGSIAFGFSAMAAYVIPTTGLPKNEMIVNLGTFIGAICFSWDYYFYQKEPNKKNYEKIS